MISIITVRPLGLIETGGGRVSKNEGNRYLSQNGTSRGCSEHTYMKVCMSLLYGKCYFQKYEIYKENINFERRENFQNFISQSFKTHLNL